MQKIATSYLGNGWLQRTWAWKRGPPKKKQTRLYFVNNPTSILFTLNIPVISLQDFLLIKEDSTRLGNITVQFSHWTQSCSTLCDPVDCSTPGLPVHHPAPTACSNSCWASDDWCCQSSSWWCHSTILSSVAPFSSCLQSFPASGSFAMNQFFTSDGQRIGVSASASVLPMNIQDWFPLGWTGWIYLQSRGLSRVFSSTTVQKHQFFGPQLSL